MFPGAFPGVGSPTGERAALLYVASPRSLLQWALVPCVPPPALPIAYASDFPSTSIKQEHRDDLFNQHPLGAITRRYGNEFNTANTSPLFETFR